MENESSGKGRGEEGGLQVLTYELGRFVLVFSKSWINGFASLYQVCGQCWVLPLRKAHAYRAPNTNCHVTGNAME